MENGQEPIYDSPVYAKVTNEAKKRLAMVKAELTSRGFKANDQTILTALLLGADEDVLERSHQKRKR